MARTNIKFSADYKVYVNELVETGSSFQMTTNYGIKTYEAVEDPTATGIKISPNGRITAREFIEGGGN